MVLELRGLQGSTFRALVFGADLSAAPSILLSCQQLQVEGFKTIDAVKKRANVLSQGEAFLR